MKAKFTSESSNVSFMVEKTYYDYVCYVFLVRSVYRQNDRNHLRQNCLCLVSAPNLGAVDEIVNVKCIVG